MATHFPRQDDGRLEVANGHVDPTLYLHDRAAAEPVNAPLLSPMPLLPWTPLAPDTAIGNGQPQSSGAAPCHCPECDSWQTQPVPAIFKALSSQTRVRPVRGPSIFVGEGARETGLALGGASRRYAQQIQFIKRFAPPAMDCARLVEVGRSRVAAAGGGAIAAFLVIMFSLVLLGSKSPAATAALPDVGQPDAMNLFARTLATIALFGVPILVFVKVSARFDAEIARLRQDEWRAFDEKQRAWKSSFFCHRCGNVFHSAGRPEG